MSDWSRAPIPEDESERTRRIVQLGLRGRAQHETLDQLTALAARMFDAPMALVTLIDGEGQYFLSKFGIDAEGTGRAESFCGHGIHSDTPLSVPDASEDPRFAGNPLVLGGPFVRAYLGIPLLGGPGQSAVGSLCVIDHQPRQWTREDHERLAALSAMAESYLDGLAYRRVWEDSPLALMLLDREGKSVRANEALGRLLGRPLDIVIDRPLGAFVLPVDRGIFSAMLANTFQRQESPTRRELRFVRLAGEIVSGGTSMSRLVDVQDQVVCVIRDISLERRSSSRSGVIAEVRRELSVPIADARALAQLLPIASPDVAAQVAALESRLTLLDTLIDGRLDDLGARARTEEDLLVSEQRLRTVTENVLGPLLVLDDRGRIVDANVGALTELGWEYPSLIGASMRVLKPDFSEAECRRWFVTTADRMREGLPLIDELATLVRRSGTELVVELRGMVMDWNGPGRLVLIVRDITASRNRESELRRERDELAANVRTSTDRLTDQQQLEARLKESLGEKETLLKEIHHRVKNNLQIVSSLLTIQMNEMPSDAARSMLADSVQRVRSMALIHQHLYGSTSLERIDLGAYTEQLADSLRQTLAPTARLRIVAEPIEIAVENATPIGLILNELLTNAFKYGIPSDGGASPRDEDVLVEIMPLPRQLRLTVRDHGPGLPANFDLLASKSLGLKLVRALSRQLKGKLVARSDLGAVFELTFNILQSTLPPVPRA